MAFDAALVIGELERELDATQQRCGQIERLIRDLREVYGIVGDLVDVDEGDADIAAPAAAAPGEDQDAVAMLRLLAGYPAGIGLTQIVSLSGTSKTTAHRVLESLIDRKRAVKTGSGRGTRYGRVKERL